MQISRNSFTLVNKLQVIIPANVGGKPRSEAFVAEPEQMRADEFFSSRPPNRNVSRRAVHTAATSHRVGGKMTEQLSCVLAALSVFVVVVFSAERVTNLQDVQRLPAAAC